MNGAKKEEKEKAKKKKKPKNHWKLIIDIVILSRSNRTDKPDKQDDISY